jgi:hypothetical protein
MLLFYPPLNHVHSHALNNLLIGDKLIELQENCRSQREGKAECLRRDYLLLDYI